MNILISLLFLVSLVFAEPDIEEIKRGYEVFKNNCSICHREEVSLYEFLQARKNVLAGKRPENLDAPPMNLISARIKEFFPTELEFVEFVKDYITNPSREKGVCQPAAYAFFGVMPPIGESLSEEEKEAVAKWMYYRFSGLWHEIFKKVKAMEKAEK